MTRFLVSTAMISLGAVAAAQEPADRPAPKQHEYNVVVSGCIKGKRLERPVIQSAPENLPIVARGATSFILDGPKELLKQIEREHKNHDDEIVGIAIVPPSLTGVLGAIATRKVGPISIGIGGRPDTSGIERAPQLIKLKVSSIVHVQAECAR
jgi:hypothetical protein